MFEANGMSNSIYILSVQLMTYHFYCKHGSMGIHIENYFLHSVESVKIQINWRRRKSRNFRKYF